MKLEKAIEILSGDNFGRTWPTPLKEIKAVKLGIEALKLLKEIRSVDGTGYGSMLPGETED